VPRDGAASDEVAGRAAEPAAAPAPEPGGGREAEQPPVGSLAIVLHSHMPYVEGFGTYPFGEEWLFDAVARSYLPLLDVANRVTVSVSPVLADQLEAPGVADRLRAFVQDHRFRACEDEREELGAPHADACAAEAGRYRRALGRLEELGDDLLGLFRAPGHAGRVELIASAASHAVLPLLATRGGRRLQIDVGLRSHRRRFGHTAGFWLPECAYDPGLERLLAERGIEWFCVDQSAHGEPLDALAPVETPDGPVAFTIDWPAVSWLWSLDGYPAHPHHADFHRQSMRGARPWSIGGGPYDPVAAEATARRQAAEFVRRAAARLEAYRRGRDRPGLITFAIDTELLGHWWWEGPAWLDEVLRRAPELGIELVTLSEALGRHRPERRALHRATWGDGKDLRTWDSPEVADIAWAARRLELRLLRALGAARLRDEAELRAARELLALQASDWAFLDRRRQAGDYPYQRVTSHARTLLEAIHSADPPDPRLRNLAPDLTLAPLLET
jgi:1,4-alpha-glucan branching enzyme